MKKKKTVRKQSSSRLSTIASRALKRLDGAEGKRRVSWSDAVYVSDVRALAASVLSQDEIKGQKRK